VKLSEEVDKPIVQSVIATEKSINKPKVESENSKVESDKHTCDC